MDHNSFPALFRSADAASNAKQKQFLQLVLAEFTLLLVASVASLQSVGGVFAHVAYAAIFFLLVVVLLVRSLSRPQQDWYKSRALAESVKTLGWRYAMRAEPFSGSASEPVARAEFRNQLERILKQDRATVERLLPHASGEDQITEEMDRIRASALAGRKKTYLSSRVDEQKAWYAQKASANRRAATRWTVIGVLAYGVAGGMAICRLVLPAWHFWPIEPIIVFAASLIGWTQLKKYSELSAAYSVTAHEIGLIKLDLPAVTTEESFSEFVNEAERAFSREHTLWLARQTD